MSSCKISLPQISNANLFQARCTETRWRRNINRAGSQLPRAMRKKLRIQNSNPPIRGNVNHPGRVRRTMHTAENITKPNENAKFFLITVCRTPIVTARDPKSPRGPDNAPRVLTEFAKMATELSAEQERLLSVQETAQRLALSTRTIWKLCATGNFPQPLRIGGARRWRESDITAFIEDLTTARDHR